MHRRTFLAAAAAGIALPSVATAAVGAPYRPGLVKDLLDRGDTVFLDFWASWCTTCRAQSRQIDALLAANPAYEAYISFVLVDWDAHADAEITRALNIPRRSTLVALKGEEELGRVVAGTSEAQIRGLLDTALAAATA